MAHHCLPVFLVSVVLLLGPLSATPVVLDPSATATEVNSSTGLSAAIEQANTNGLKCKRKPSCLGALVSVTLISDITLPGPLPPLGPNAHLIISGKCQRKAGRCVIDGVNKYQVFPPSPGGPFFDGSAGLFELNSLIFQRAKGGVLYNVYATVVAKYIVFRLNIDGVVVNVGYFGGAPPQTFIRCNFEYNHGTAITSGNGKYGLSPAPVGIMVKRSLFKGNTGKAPGDPELSSGGAVYIAGSGTAVFENTAFINNVANSGGGAVFADQTNVFFRGVEFTGNKALGVVGGGAVLGQSGFFQKLSVAFCSSTFDKNTAPKNATVNSLLFRQFTSSSGGQSVDVAFCDTKVPKGSVFPPKGPDSNVTIGIGKKCFKKYCKPKMA